MTYRFALAACAAFALAGCGSSDKPAAPASEAPKMAEAAPAAAPAPAGPVAKGSPPTKEFVVGKWGDENGCEMAIDFKADGTTDGPFGNWSLTPDGILTMADAPQKVHVAMIDDKNMDSWMDDNPKHRKMVRCP